MYKKIFIIIVVITSALGATAKFFPTTQTAHERSFAIAAENIVEACKDAVYRPSCYDEEIPKLMDEGLSMEDSFAVTRIVQDIDPSYQYCHVLGHYLSARETAKDPLRWKDVVARAPLGVCSNGAIHGAFQERFRVEAFETDEDINSVVAELEGVCMPREGWEPTQLGQATCTHGLGHLTMYITNAQIEKSLALCDRLLADDETHSVRQLCYDGAFMQIYQPLEPEDFALIAGKEIETKEAADVFCAQFEGAKRGSCLSESWPLYRAEMMVPETIVSICDRSRFDPWQHERCYNAMFYVAMAQANLEVDWAVGFCGAIEKTYRDSCFSNSATRLIEVDDRNVEKALTLCHEAEAVGAGEACFKQLIRFSAYTFKTDSSEFYQLCSGMPESLQEQCFSQKSRVTVM